MEALAKLLTGLIWVAGWVVAKGFWPTFFAVIFPPWSVYLVIEWAINNLKFC